MANLFIILSFWKEMLESCFKVKVRSGGTGLALRPASCCKKSLAAPWHTAHWEGPSARVTSASLPGLNTPPSGPPTQLGCGNTGSSSLDSQVAALVTASRSFGAAIGNCTLICSLLTQFPI